MPSQMRLSSRIALLCALTGCATPDAAVRVDDARLIDADKDSANWLTYGRTYSEQRFSPLRQINDATVGRLGQPLGRMQTQCGGFPNHISRGDSMRGSFRRGYALTACLLSVAGSRPLQAQGIGVQGACPPRYPSDLNEHSNNRQGAVAGPTDFFLCPSGRRYLPRSSS